MEKRYQVYVIRNEAGRQYIGLSEEVAQRLVDHNTGVSKWVSMFSREKSAFIIC